MNQWNSNCPPRIKEHANGLLGDNKEEDNLLISNENTVWGKTESTGNKEKWGLN